MTRLGLLVYLLPGLCAVWPDLLPILAPPPCPQCHGLWTFPSDFLPLSCVPVWLMFPQEGEELSVMCVFMGMCVQGRAEARRGQQIP